MHGKSAEPAALVALCERVIEDRSGQVTLVGLVNQLRRQQAAGGLGPVPAALSLYVHVTTDEPRVDVAIRQPTGETTHSWSLDIAQGAALASYWVLPIAALARVAGDHWCEVSLAGRVVARWPLRLVLTETESTAGDAAGSSRSVVLN